MSSITEILSWSDYYPFGLAKNNRSSQSSSYRFGFNGKEKDSWAANGNIYDYGFRIYNPQYGKFLSVDPLTKSYPMLTPYQFASNTPIMASDLDGLEARVDITFDQEDFGFLNGTITEEEIKENRFARGIAGVIGLDLYLSGGLFSLGYIMGDATHSMQMQTYYRDRGDEKKADEYKAEGGAAASNIIAGGLVNAAFRGVPFVLKGARKLVGPSPKPIRSNIRIQEPYDDVLYSQQNLPKAKANTILFDDVYSNSTKIYRPGYTLPTKGYNFSPTEKGIVYYGKRMDYVFPEAPIFETAVPNYNYMNFGNRVSNALAITGLALTNEYMELSNMYKNLNNSLENNEDNETVVKQLD